MFWQRFEASSATGARYGTLNSGMLHPCSAIEARYTLLVDARLVKVCRAESNTCTVLSCAEFVTVVPELLELSQLQSCTPEAMEPGLEIPHRSKMRRIGRVVKGSFHLLHMSSQPSRRNRQCNLLHEHEKRLLRSARVLQRLRQADAQQGAGAYEN